MRIKISKAVPTQLHARCVEKYPREPRARPESRPSTHVSQCLWAWDARFRRDDGMLRLLPMPASGLAVAIADQHGLSADGNDELFDGSALVGLLMLHGGRRACWPMTAEAGGRCQWWSSRPATFQVQHISRHYLVRLH